MFEVDAELGPLMHLGLVMVPGVLLGQVQYLLNVGCDRRHSSVFHQRWPLRAQLPTPEWLTD